MCSEPARARILVVEDEIIVARDIEQQLHQMGYLCAGRVSNGEAAIALARQERPDLVLMDIRLPGAIDGIEAARIIRTELGLPVVFLTAFAVADTITRAKQAQPFGYITKPFSAPELQACLEMALHMHQAEKHARATDLALAAQLRELSAHHMRAKEQEQQRIAREIHDELGGFLTGIKSYLSVMIGRDQRAGSSADPLMLEAANMADQAIETLRRIIAELRPSVLDQLGVWAALEWYSGQIEQRTALRCDCIIDEALADIVLDAASSTAIFRIVQELITNAVRHAQAGTLEVRAACDGADILITVQDDGKGVETAQLLGEKSWGIMGMHERAHQIAGALRISGMPGRGTLAQLRVPLARNAAVIPAPAPIPAAPLDHADQAQS